MTKRNGRRTNTPASKQNAASPSQNLTVSPSTDQLDYQSGEYIHGESETTSEFASSDDERTRLPVLRQRGHHSWLGTVVSLCTLHALLLVVYGVHSKWHWAMGLTDVLSNIAGWSSANDDSDRNYQNVSLRMRFTLNIDHVMAARRRGMRTYDFPYDEQGVDRRRNLSLREFRDVYDGKWPVIIEDVLPTWTASNWSHAFLCSTYGHERIAMTGVRGGLETSQSMVLPLQSFCDHVTDTGWTLWTYVQDELFLPMRQLLRRDVGTSIYTEDDLFELFPAEVRPWDAMLLWGTTYSRSTLHIDPYNWTGTNAVISGRKRWKLFHPSQDHLLYVKHGIESQFPLKCYKYNSAVDSFEVDYEQRYPLMSKAKYIEFDQVPGDLLIIPSGWFHQALNMEETIAVSGELTNVNNYRVVLEEILKLKDNLRRQDIPLNSHLLSPAEQVKLVMSLLSDDVLSRGQEVTKDILKQMNYINHESTEQSINQHITN